MGKNSKKKQQSYSREIPVESSTQEKCGTESGSQRYSIKNSEQELDVYLQLEYDSTMRWGGVLCPRFMDFAEIFPDETAPYRDGTFAENPEEGILLSLKNSLESAVANASPGSKAWILRERGIRRFNCHFYHIVSHCYDKQCVDAPNTINYFKELASEQENARYESLCQKRVDKDFYLPDFPNTNLAVHFVQKFRSNDGLVRAIEINMENLEKVEVKIDADNGVEVTGAVISFNNGVKWKNLSSPERRDENGNSYYFSFGISLAEFMEIPEKFKIEVKTTGGNKDYNYPCGNPEDEIIKFCGNRNLSGREQLKKCVLFMDMGSTRVKYVLVPQNGNELDLRNLIPKVVKTELCISSTADDTRKLNILKGMDSFVEEKKISTHRIKGEIAANNGALMAEFFIAAVKKISDYLWEWEQNKTILTEIYWSFPQTSAGQNDIFSKVEKEVSNAVKSYVYSPGDGPCFFLNPEHIALKNAFTNMINEILVPMFNDCVKALKERENAAEKEYQDVKNARSWGKNLLHLISFGGFDQAKRIRNEKVAGIADYRRSGNYRQMEILRSELHANPQGMRNFLLLDGGGYSLDAYCEIDGKENHSLCRSFECGGEALFDKYCKECYEVLDRGKIDAGLENEIRKDLAFPHQIRCDKDRKIEKIRNCIDSLYDKPYTFYDRDSGPTNKIKILALTGQVMMNKLLQEKFLTRAQQNDGYCCWRAAGITTAIVFELLASVPGDIQKEKEYKSKIDDLKALVERDGKIVSDFDLLAGMLCIAKGRDRSSAPSPKPQAPSRRTAGRQDGRTAENPPQVTIFKYPSCCCTSKKIDRIILTPKERAKIGLKYEDGTIWRKLNGYCVCYDPEENICSLRNQGLDEVPAMCRQ